MKPKLYLFGHRGKMGKEILRLTKKTYQKSFSSVVPYQKHTSLGEGDLLIDFTRAQATEELCKILLSQKTKNLCLIVGTTGLNLKTERALKIVAKNNYVLYASNFSISMTFFRKAISSFLQQRGLSYDSRIIETHHVMKKDKPSGTALTLKKEIDPFLASTKIKSIRKGKVVGTHEVIFSNDFEEITLIHHAKKRSIFCDGALRAALMMHNIRQKKGKKKIYEIEELFLL